METKMSVAVAACSQAIRMSARGAGRISLCMLLLSSEALAKGTPPVTINLKSPGYFETSAAGNFLIAPGEIQIVTNDPSILTEWKCGFTPSRMGRSEADTRDELRKGRLYGPQSRYGIAFQSGTLLTTSDANLDVMLTSAENIQIGGMEVGPRLTFLLGGDERYVSVATSLTRPATVLGLPLAPSSSFMYECRGLDCQSVSRLESFTLGAPANLMGVDMPAGTKVWDLNLAPGFNPPQDMRVQGILVRGGTHNDRGEAYWSEYGYAQEFSLYESGRLRCFQSAEPTVLQGISIPKDALVLLRDDGTVERVHVPKPAAPAASMSPLVNQQKLAALDDQLRRTAAELGK